MVTDFVLQTNNIILDGIVCIKCKPVQSHNIIGSQIELINSDIHVIL